MQHEMMRHPAPPLGADNVGDVLASIRRLIAQDDAGCRIPNQALNTLPAQDIAPRIRVEPMVPVVPDTAAAPLVLDSTDLVAAAAEVEEARETTVAPAEPTNAPTAQAEPAAEIVTGTLAGMPADAVTEPLAEPQAETVAETTEPAPAPAPVEAANSDFGDWLKLPVTGPAHSVFAAAWPQSLDTGTGTAEQTETAPALAGAAVEPLRPFGPFREHTPTTTNAQMEETMLHANSTVTPINPLAEAHAAAEALNRESEQHLFAPQDKDTQKGTHLRGMIREAIRQELQGEIGNRLSRNLQQMIRHEIELTLRQMCEQE